ncbi:MAG: hypothetical protein WBN38_09245, partial [Polyangiales bacterium]
LKRCSQPARTHLLPDISNLESHPTRQFGFDIGAFLDPDGLRELHVANEAIEQWSDDSKVALGLVNDWSMPNSPYIQVPEKTEPPIRIELMTYGLRITRCTQCFQEARGPVDQSCPFERIEELIRELEKLAKCRPKCPKGLTGK